MSVDVKAWYACGMALGFALGASGMVLLSGRDSGSDRAVVRPVEVQSQTGAPLFRGRAHTMLVADSTHAWVRVGTRSVLVHGATNARPPTTYPRPQTRFALRYGAKQIPNRCGHYQGPLLPLVLRACTAPDGSHWVLQGWRRLGRLGTQGAFEIHVSHWTGDPAKIELYATWRYRSHYRRVVGRFTYQGHPVYGFRNTPEGKPLDAYSRNVYIDTLNSGYGRGWHRVEGLLTHRSTGAFCWLVPTKAQGEAYRVTIEGPGVTPIVRAAIPDPGPYDGNHEAQIKAVMSAWGDRKCY